MADMRHAGVHWPANAGGEHPDRETIYKLPGVKDGCLLICADSARYWYNEARARCPTVVWRAIPRQGKLPADLNWSASRVAKEVLNLWNEQAHGYTSEWFLPLNELQFEKEAGENFPGYNKTAARLELLRLVLANTLPPSVKLVYPAWVPSDELEHTEDWVPEAKKWDVICLHAYGSALDMRIRYYEYRQLFPDHKILVGEWNANHTGADEAEALEMWAEVAAKDPLFLGATYYIWETRNGGEEDLSIWGNSARLRLFQGPPTEVQEEAPLATEVFPLPVDGQGNEWAPSYRDIVDAVPVVADEYGLHRDLLGGLFFAEAGVNLGSLERWSTYTDEARGYIEARNKAGLADILGRMQLANSGVGTNDLSFGPGHQSWFWWEGYPGNRQPGDPHRYNLDEILAFRKLMIQDHGGAMRLAAKQLRAYADKYGQDTNEALYRYNKPDGSASTNVKANYDRGRAKAVATWGTSVAPVEPPAIPAPTSSIQFLDYTDPQPAGRFSIQPNGVILHGSRSGKASNPIHAEFIGTAGYEVNNTLGYGWNATIGEGEVATHLDAKHWGWNARSPASGSFLAVEFAQPVSSVNISDAQVDAFVEWYRREVLPTWPGIPRDFPTHAEVENWGLTGAHDGKTDVFPYLDPRADELRSRIMARLGIPVPVPAEGELASARNLVGNAYNEDGVVIPALLGARAGGDWPQVDAVVKWLRDNRA